MSNSMVHLILDIKSGRSADIVRFHSLLWWLDPNWPFAQDNHWDTYKFRTCKKCGGRVYESPRLVPEDIKAAARQCGVRVSVQVYRDWKKCFADGQLSYKIPPVHELVLLQNT